MTTLNSTRLNQSSSTSKDFDQLDPTTLAISLIPLLPIQLFSQQQQSQDQHHQSFPPITLPSLAASLSTLPQNVTNAIHTLAQELKSLREQHVLSVGIPNKDSNLPSADGENQDREKANREKWLENQKVNHLKKSISSLTNLQSTLQSRLLTTVDTLSDLQQTHKRETQQLTDERDGVRAVNQVLKRKIVTLENQLRESKEVMESVLERVQVANKGDWSIVEHGVIHLHSPLPYPSAAQDESVLSEELCTFHQQCQADNLPQDYLETCDPLAKQTMSPASRNQLNRSTSSDLHRSNQRSLTLVVELTEELESLRQEIKVELKLKHDEIHRLKGLISYRDDQIHQLMCRLEHFMGLDGFYIRNQNQLPLTNDEFPSSNSFNPITDVESTPRQRTDRHQPKLDTGSSRHQSNQHRKLEEEIKQLETQLKEVTNSSRQFVSPNETRTNYTTFALDHQSGKSVINDRSSMISINALDDQAISRVLADLSSQVADLKLALKETIRERDALKRLKSRNKNLPSSCSSSSSITDQDLGSGAEASRALKEALDRSRSECTRLNRLLARSESRILELERQMAEQEAEFEKVAERVQEKLKDQRAKMLEAQARIEDLQGEVERVTREEKRTREKLEEEEKRVEMLMGMVEKRRRGEGTSATGLQPAERGKERRRERKDRDGRSASSVSSSASSAAHPPSLQAPPWDRSPSPKDPFNV